MSQGSADRLRLLCAALEAKSSAAPDMEFHPTAEYPVGLVIRLSSARGPFAVLSVSMVGVTVTTSSGGLHADAGDSEIVDTLRIDLSSDYSWDDVACDTADELAHLLIKHMRRRIRDADPEPQPVGLT
jgi:hypothetical protein